MNIIDPEKAGNLGFAEIESLELIVGDIVFVKKFGASLFLYITDMIAIRRQAYKIQRRRFGPLFRGRNWWEGALGEHLRGNGSGDDARAGGQQMTAVKNSGH